MFGVYFNDENYESLDDNSFSIANESTAVVKDHLVVFLHFSCGSQNQKYIFFNSLVQRNCFVLLCYI